MEKEKNPAMIGSLQIGLGIVDIIASQEHPMKFTEIQEKSNITKSNLYKYLNTLTHLELLYRDKQHGTYTLGSKIISYGMAAIGQQDLVTKVTPFLQEISRFTSLTALLAVWTHSGPVIANIWNANNGLNIGAQIGTHLPILSSSGKVFSAFHEPLLIEEWKNTEMQNWSVEDKQLFEEETEVIKKRQISFAKEPLVPYISSASVPLFNYNNDLLGCLTLVGFSQIVPQTSEDEYGQYLLNISKEASGIFGYK
ncbi:IclR family transcriptional regulator [Peribacillus asahii]|uniref:IclR family transcriptional regulator n=1 Tax=Peribacillus asahii TaxID=228899 RepID=UPI0020793ED0|nr:IclR family transcriptional regulator [Peribacillus asahii]USK86759.1 IclR family transcriptional regulator [Peribacillus asahii]